MLYEVITVSYDEPHGPCICPKPFNNMYDGFKFDDNPNFEDDLSKKPLMQQLWAGVRITSYNVCYTKLLRRLRNKA